jgi:hypothetical protein
MISSKVGNSQKVPAEKIDTSELLRVFGNPAERRTKQEESEHIEELKKLDAGHFTKHFLDTSEKDMLKAQIKTLEEALGKAYDRENQHLEQVQWQRQHIDKLTDTIKILEPPKPQEQEKPKGFFRRIFSKSL